MNQFKDFNIKPEISAFTGQKIKIDWILNTQITVLDYKIEDSKAKPGTKYLTLHIEKNTAKHVVFTGSRVLANMIRKIPKDKFPFQTTIVKQNEYYEFT